MRIVLDTSVLISGIISADSPPAKLYEAWLDGKFDLVTSAEQIVEFRRVSGYEKLQRFLKPEKVELLLDGLENLAEIASNLPQIDVSPDPDDNFIIATAIAGKANYIVSGDKQDLLALGQVENIEILTARAAWEMIQR